MESSKSKSFFLPRFVLPIGWLMTEKIKRVKTGIGGVTPFLIRHCLPQKW